jgi:hypothetical protein
LVVLQNLAEGRLLSVTRSTSSRDAYQAISVEAEEMSQVEEEYPVPTTSPVVYAEPKVSCVSVRWISRIQVSLVS